MLANHPKGSILNTMSQTQLHLPFPHTATIGKFSADSGCIILFDVVNAKRVELAAVGEWHVLIERPLLPYWGARVASVTLLHEDIVGSAQGEWEECESNIRIDSGVLAAFDSAEFAHANESSPERDAFHERMNGECFAKGNEVGGMVEEGGAFFRPPMTEGEYTWYCRVNNKGQVVGVSIDLASDESEMGSQFGWAVRAWRELDLPEWARIVQPIELSPEALQKARDLLNSPPRPSKGLLDAAQRQRDERNL